MKMMISFMCTEKLILSRILKSSIRNSVWQTLKRSIKGRNPCRRCLNLTEKEIQKKARILRPLLGELKSALEAGNPARAVTFDKEEREVLSDLHLMTMKKNLYVCNVDENSVIGGNEFMRQVENYAEKEGSKSVVICGKIESEIASLDSEEEREEFLREIGWQESGLKKLVRAAYNLLGLKTYFTAGEKEVRAWTYRNGMTAPECAGVIHTDFQRGFIKAETYNYDDLMALKTEQKVREAGKLRQEGKEYLVRDGDIIHFKFNV